ncbi:MAG TPA: UrcA family protein [Caulobacterales bacterium]|nr:UrcA family protein [Caulobacterales bacterium]
MRRSVIAVTTLALSAFAAPAFADPDTVQVRIQVTPADLESRDAVAHLYQRINAAAASVCAEVMGDQTPTLGSAYASRLDCRRQLVREALENTHFAALAQYYAELQGSPPPATEVASR